MGDAQALMLASIVARRCAEHPDVALKLEKRGTAQAVFEQLETCLGQGLFNIELFWILRALAEIGVVRTEGLAMFKDRIRTMPEAADSLKAVAQDNLAKIDATLEGNEFICGDRYIVGVSCDGEERVAQEETRVLVLQRASSCCYWGFILR